jgi:hypothetical protein
MPIKKKQRDTMTEMSLHKRPKDKEKRIKKE